MELSKNTNISFENQKVTLTANSQTIEVPLSNEIIGEKSEIIALP
jgi:hypothetical protein